MNSKPTFSYALFDMDGLLLDTEIIYTKVTQSIVGRYDKLFDWSIKANMIGRPAIDSARYLVQQLDLPITAQDYLDERNSLLEVEFGNCEALPGAENLIRELHHRAIPIALASSSSYKHYQIKTSKHRHWFDLFDAVITGDNPEIKNGKPAPDIFLHAASELGAQINETVVFEDAPSGLQAGKSAGMQVVVVPNPQMDRSRFPQADYILSSLEDFDLSLFGLSC